jgi:hypothetical protein
MGSPADPPSVIKVDIQPLPGLDLQADWLTLPRHYARASIDCLVWDPIHVADVGKNSQYCNRYVAQQNPFTGESVAHLYAGFLEVAAWLVKSATGIVLVKLSDQVHNGRQQWQVFNLVAEAKRRDWTALRLHRRSKHVRLKHELTCVVCGKQFSARRSDAKTHDGTCRPTLNRHHRRG